MSQEFDDHNINYILTEHSLVVKTKINDTKCLNINKPIGRSLNFFIMIFSPDIKSTSISTQQEFSSYLWQFY